VKEMEPFLNPVIEVAQFRFAQFVDVDDQFVGLFPSLSKLSELGGPAQDGAINIT
jgi:hypothetical protein